MEPILNKQEIAELLGAIRSGQVPLDDRIEAGEQFLDAKEIDLFNMAVTQSEESRFPNFDLILDNFCRHYSIALTNELQRTFNITRVSLEAVEFQEFMATLGTPGAIGILNMPPLKQGVLFMADPRLSFSFIEMMLGASPEIDITPPNRSLTTLELTILKPLLGLACGSFDRVLRPLVDLNTTLHKVESNPRLVSITEQDSEVLVSRLTVDMRETTGEITVAFPVATLSPLREKLKGLLNLHEMTKGSWLSILERSVQDMPTTLTAQSGTMELTVGQILGLNEGDILPLDYDPNSPLKILVGDRLKFKAKPGTHRGKKAISITGVYDN